MVFVCLVFFRFCFSFIMVLKSFLMLYNGFLGFLGFFGLYITVFLVLLWGLMIVFRGL